MKTRNSSARQFENTKPPKQSSWYGVESIITKAYRFVNSHGVLSSFLSSALWALGAFFFAPSGKVFEEKIRNSFEWQFGLAACAISSFIVIGFSVYYIAAAMDKKSMRLDLQAAQRQLGKHNELGLVYIWASHNAEHIDINYQEMKDAIEESADRKLELLFTTGYEAMSMDAEHETIQFKNRFSEKPDGQPRKAVLHELIQNLKGPVRVLLLNPLSQTAFDRGREIINDGDLYRQLIYRTIAFLELAKERNENLHLDFGFYSQKPVWNVVRNNIITFVQPVSPNYAARLNAWLCFANNNFGITEGFATLFEKKWDERQLEDVSHPDFRTNVDKIKHEIEAKMK